MTNIFKGDISGGRVIQVGAVVGGVDLGALRGASVEAGPLPSVRDLPYFGPEQPTRWWQRKRNQQVPDLGPDGRAIADTLLAAFEPKEALSLLNLVAQLHQMDQGARDRATESWRSVYHAKVGRLLNETGQHPGSWRPDAVERAMEIISGA